MKRISTRLAVSFLIVALLPTLPLSLVVPAGRVFSIHSR